MSRRWPWFQPAIGKILAAAMAGLLVAMTMVHGARAAEDDNGAAPRHTLGKAFACADYGGNKVCLVDKDGKITWSIEARRPIDVWVLANGNILFSHVHGAKELTRAKEVVWEYTTAKGNEIHACQPLPDGNVMVAESGPMRIIEVDRQGRIAKEVKLATKCTVAHLQMRGARKLVNGNYLVGQWSDEAVREYGPTGNIVREFPHKMAYGGVRLPNGNTLIATGDMHRIFEVDGQGKTVWEINENDLPGNPLRFVAGMQRLANGNTVVCNWGGHGHVGQQPQLFEVTRDKKVVGEFFDNAQFVTIAGVYLMDGNGDPSKYEVLR